MIRFECDYCEGAHPRLMERLMITNMAQTPGYSEDEYCEQAREYIKTACGAASADVHFLVGGTQTNTTVIKSILRPHQGVVTASTGHINVHETGAIENSGHKVLTIPSDHGKITAGQVQELYEAHYHDVNHEHMVQPGMVYISNPTENGVTYSKGELTDLSHTCRKLGLPLYMDGARLGYGIMSHGSDIDLKDVARLCDIFYIGGTKVGALFGEAVVITDLALKKDFRYFIKQQGGLLAKGRLLGVQFGELFKDGLYFEISRHAVIQAMRIRSAFLENGVKMRYDSYTNQQFPILPDEVLEPLSEKYAFSFWEKTDINHTAVRFCTSWATEETNVTMLVEDLHRLLN